MPGLSSALVDRLKRDFASIDEIQISIAPGQQMPRGAAILRAVLKLKSQPLM